MKLIFSFLMAIRFSISFAASAPSLISQETDASISYLSMIFGVVDGVLHGSGSQITGQLFRLLSTILLCCAGVLWTYVTFVGVLNTASEGQFLGQRWSSMWIPLRVVGGFCLLIPKGITGYSLIQVMVMSVIVQGVGAANLAWKKTLDYLGEGGTVVESVRFFQRGAGSQNESTDFEETVHHELLERAADVLKSEVCMMVFHYALQGNSYQHGLAPPLNFTRTLNLGNNIKSVPGGRRVIEFPAISTPEIFGSITWTTNPVSKVMISQGQQYDLHQAAVEILVLNLLPVAQRIALKVISTPSKADQGSAAKTENFFTQGEDFSLVKSIHSAMGMLKIANRERLLEQEHANHTKLKEQQNEMKEAGWITAGNWYRLLAQANQNNVSFGMSNLQGKINSTCVNDQKVQPQLSDKWQRANFNSCLQELEKFSQEEKSRLAFYHRAPWLTHSPVPIDPFESYINKWLLDPFQVSNQRFKKRMQSILDQKRDPIIALSTIGTELLQAIEETWNKIYTSGWQLMSQDLAIQQGLSEFVRCMALLPILVTWMLLNFTLGSILVYYVPLIPFLVFFFRSLTWFGSVIIAIVAAPCVAVGVMSPEGHPVMGFAEQAIRRLVDLFLCPILMVLGLVCGMVLCTIVFELFHYGYSIVITGIPESQGILAGVSQIAITTVYTTVAITIVSRCFALIYELPAKTLSWIGWPTEGHSEAEVLSQVRGGIEQRVGSVGQSVTGRLVEEQRPQHGKSSHPSYDAKVFGGN